MMPGCRPKAIPGLWVFNRRLARYIRAMTVTFRTMTKADLAAAAALWHEGWHDGHAAICPPALTRQRTEASFRDRLSRDVANARVALRADRVAGFHILKDNELYQFFVAPAERGSGLARLLMQDAETALRMADHDRAWLACTVGNARAARFYEKTGWTRMATERMEFETADGPFALDAWRYEKAL